MPHHLVAAQWMGRITIQPFSKRYVVLLAALSSSFFYLAWCSFWFGGLLLVAIVPILGIIKLLTITPKQKSCCLFSIVCTLFLWNALTIWWIYKAAFTAFLFVACYNTLCLTLPCFFYYYMRKWGGLYAAYLGLVMSWLTLEHAHLSWEYWELSFPWLNLGNGLAALPQWIQWYEYTGILGGSLWVLIVNILLYHLIFEQANPYLLHGWYGGILLPIAISLMIYYRYSEKGIDVEAVVVQPNFDSYTEKDHTSPCFVPYARQIDRLLTLSKSQLTPATCLVIWPESAVDCWLEEVKIRDHILMRPIFQFLEPYAAVNLITGISTRCVYGPTKATKTAQISRGAYVDYFNSVLHLKTGRKIDIYHKHKRLPGGEYIPYFHFLSETVCAWLKQKFVDIGNIDPCLGKGNGTQVFAIEHQIKVAPIICYELLYGAFVGSSVQKGAHLFAVVTNDGWWGNTPIYHHFFQYSRLLAIAHRRSVMRAANTGISGFINQRGKVIAGTNRLEATAIRAVVHANNQMTFYSLYGDYIGRIASWGCLILFCMVWMLRLRQKNTMPKRMAKVKPGAC